MTDYTRRWTAFWRDGWYWLVGGVVVLLVIAEMVVWNTAYSAGRSDGIMQLSCIQEVNAKRLQGMTEKQREDYLSSPVHAYPSQCP